MPTDRIYGDSLQFSQSCFLVSVHLDDEQSVCVSLSGAHGLQEVCDRGKKMQLIPNSESVCATTWKLICCSKLVQVMSSPQEESNMTLTQQLLEEVLYVQACRAASQATGTLLHQAVQSRQPPLCERNVGKAPAGHTTSAQSRP